MILLHSVFTILKKLRDAHFWPWRSHFYLNHHKYFLKPYYPASYYPLKMLYRVQPPHLTLSLSTGKENVHQNYYWNLLGCCQMPMASSVGIQWPLNLSCVNGVYRKYNTIQYNPASIWAMVFVAGLNNVAAVTSNLKLIFIARAFATKENLTFAFFWPWQSPLRSWNH